MRQRGELDLGGYDWATLLLWWTLVFSGWAMIFAAGYIDKDSFTTFWDMDKNYGKQLIWIVVGATLVGGIQLLEVKFYETFAPVFYGFAAILLVGVLFTAPIKGATSWFNLGGFRFQPSEFAKVTTCLMLSYFLSITGKKQLTLKAKIQAVLIIMFPMFLVLLQGDAGSTLVYFSFFLVLFLAGLDAWIYAIGVVIAILSIASLLYDTTWWLMNLIILIANALLMREWRKDNLWTGLIALEALITFLLFSEDWFLIISALNVLILFALLIANIANKNWQSSLGVAVIVVSAIFYTSTVNYIVNNWLKPHQQERIWVWLRPEKCDPLGPLYNLEQSKFAIGSGGWTGKGFLQGERTKLDYVPEQSTDFIFCTVGEEWGFLGTTFIILVFFGLILRIFYIARRQRSTFAKFYAYGVASILFFHTFINIGMTVGLVPVIGIPLPFISYGGSSLMSFSILMGILIKLDSNRLMVFR